MFGLEKLRRDFAAGDMDFNRNAIGNGVVDSISDADRGTEVVARPRSVTADV
jgi:hypothetical protein